MYLPEGSVGLVEFGHPVEGEEKLTAVGVGPTVGHRKDAPLVVSDGVHDLIFEGSPVDTLADLACPSGIAALDDET